MIVRAYIRAIIAVAVVSLVGCGSIPVVSPIMLRSTDVVAGSSIFASALALDANGTPHIAFISAAAQHELRYQVGSGPAETVTAIGEPGQMEFSLSLALTSGGIPGLAYEQGGQLFYSTRGAAGWKSEPVDRTAQVGYFAALAYDRAGQPHISYFDQHGNDIKYATRTAAGWWIETIDASGQPGFHIPAGFTQIAVGCRPAATGCAGERPQVVYLSYRYKPYDGELRHAVRLDHGWQITTIDAERGAGGFPCLAIDSYGNPWLSYYRASTWDFAWGELRLAHLDDRGWHVETLDQGSYVGRYNALALDPAGRPVIAYYTTGQEGLRMMWYDERWRQAPITASGGAWVTLAIDAGLTIHMTFVDRIERHTRYATLPLPGTAQHSNT